MKNSPFESGHGGPLLAGAAAVACHATSLGGGFIWLDHAHIEERLAIAAPSTWPALFMHEFAGTGYYRPLVALSLSIDALISTSATFFRATTLGWHAVASAMTVLAARAFGISERAALVAGLLFAAHPATSLVASAIAFRSEAMVVVFLLGMLVAHLGRKPILAAFALAAGALTKETAWVLGPLFVVLLELERLFRSRIEPRAGAARSESVPPSTARGAVVEGPAPRRLLVAEALAFATVSVMHVAYAPGFRAHYPALSPGEAAGSRLAALGKGAVSVLLPWNDAICDAFPVTGVFSGRSLLGALVLATLPMLVRRQGPLGLLFAASLLPSLQLVPIMRWWSPHYFYLALALGAMLVVRAVDSRVPHRLPFLASLAVPLAVVSARDSRKYVSDAALWAPEVASEPACREGHFYLAETARLDRDWARAADHYERAARPTPGYLAYVDEAAAFQNLGAVRMEQGRSGEARAAWTSALGRTREPYERRKVVHNLAVLALKSGDPAEAARLLEPEMNADPPMAESLFVRAKALHELGRDDEARATVDELMRLRAAKGLEGGSEGPAEPRN